MISVHPEVLDVLEALIEKITVYKISLSSISVGNALYGMKCMSSDHEEVRTMLAALIPKIESMTYPLEMRDISSSFIGLREMGEDVPEVAAMMILLTNKLTNCAEDLGPKSLHCITTGLMSKDPDHPSVSGALTALGKKLMASKVEFSIHALLSAISNMKRMDNKNKSVQFFQDICKAKIALLDRTNPEIEEKGSPARKTSTTGTGPVNEP